MDYSNPGETKWNIDDARMKSLEFYLENLEMAFISWDLDGINRWLRAVIRVILGTGNKSEETIIKNEIKRLEEIKRDIDSQKEGIDINKKKIEFYSKAEEILEEINRQNVTSGVYFRKGKDPTKAAIDM